MRTGWPASLPRRGTGLGFDNAGDAAWVLRRRRARNAKAGKRQLPGVEMEYASMILQPSLRSDAFALPPAKRLLTGLQREEAADGEPCAQDSD